jgi:NAD-dependent SIR2 family protein deacetylase
MGEHTIQMYCPECDEQVPENYSRDTERFECESCNSIIYENKAEYIDIVHGVVMFNKNHGYGAFAE